MSPQSPSIKGFTLVELTVVMSVTLVILSAAGTLALGLSNSSVDLLEQNSLLSKQMTVMDRIFQELSSARAASIVATEPTGTAGEFSTIEFDRLLSVVDEEPVFSFPVKIGVFSQANGTSSLLIVESDGTERTFAGGLPADCLGFSIAGSHVTVRVGEVLPIVGAVTDLVSGIALRQ